MTLEQLIKEATARGIVPGATIVTPYGDTEIVPDPPRYTADVYGCGYIDDGRRSIFTESGVWATVITPAPQAGLKHGDACKDFTPAQKDYALARAKELGVIKDNPSVEGEHLFFGGEGLHVGVCLPIKGSQWGQQRKNFMPFNQFMELMERTVITKPLTINSYEVKKWDGHVSIGCFTLKNEEVLAVEAAMNREVKVKGVPVVWNDAAGEATFAEGHTVKYEDIKKVVELIKTKQQ